VPDLAGQLDADRAGPRQQDPVRAGECLMRLPDLLTGAVGVGQVALGRERVTRS